MTDEEKKREKEKETEKLIKRLIVFGGFVFVFLSVLLGFKMLGFFDLIN